MRLSDAVVQASVWPDARTFFEAVGKAVDAIARIDEQLMFGIEGVTRKPGMGPKPVTGDPTASAALFAESAHARLDDLKAERESMELTVGAGLAVIEGVRAGLGERYADVLDARHVDKLTWDECADRAGVSKMTAIRDALTAYEWVDSVGWRRAIEGRGNAER